MTTQPLAQDTHLGNNLDAIRIVAATTVLFTHHYALTGQKEPSFFGTHSFGGLAVTVFFIISGYLVNASWQRDPHLLRFALRRVLRILPALAVVLVLTAYGLGTLVTKLPAMEYVTHRATADYLQGIWMKIHFVLPGVFEGNPYRHIVNGSLWTIPIEVRCYIVLGLMGVLGLLKYRPVLLLSVMFYMVWFLARSNADVTGAVNYTRELGAFFLAGAALYTLEPYWRRRPATWAAVIAVAFAIAWAVDWRHTALLIGLPFLIVFVGTNSTPVIRHAGRWGDPSYGIYLYAFPIQQAVVHYAWPQAGFTGTLGLALVLTVAAAYASWHCIEKPALAFKPHKSDNPLLRTETYSMAFQRILARPGAVTMVTVLLLACGALLRFHHLGDFSFWDDELFSVSNVVRAGPWNGPLLPERSMAQLEISDSFWTWKLADPHPPLYEMLLVPWIALWGMSEFAIRSLSAAFGILTMLSALALPRSITPPTRLVYLMLLATSGCLLIYSQEARNYALSACLCAWMLVCLLRDMEYAPERLKEGRVSIVLLILGGMLAFTHYYGLVFACSIAFYLLTQVRSVASFVRLSWRWLAALAATFVYIGLGWVGILTKLNAAPPEPLSFAMSFKRNVLGLLRDFYPAAVGTTAFWVFMLLGLIGVFAYLHKRPSPSLRTAILMLAGVLLLFFVVQVIGTRRAEFIHERYMIFMVPGCLLLVALFTQLPGWPKVAAGLLVIALVPAGLRVWQQSPRPMGYGDWRGGAALVSHLYRPGDVILVPMDQPVMMAYFQHYLKDHIPMAELERNMVGGRPIATLVEQVRQRERRPNRIIIFSHYAFRNSANAVLHQLQTELHCKPGPLQSAQTLHVIEVTCNESTAVTQ
ncbi:MAG: hypothetical protein BGN90_09230 [Acidovorax sp. 65-7]|nr:MAG: hypothetical protein BGN90_09230 [Acidovorax sp. 65-7]